MKRLIEEKRKITPEIIKDEEIYLNGNGKFPKKLIIIEANKRIEYRLIKTSIGRYCLNR